jgi:Flp pilus assembly protein TadD
MKSKGWRQRLAVARAADPDVWRNRLRDRIEGKDLKAVEELAAAGVEKEWPVQTLALLAGLAFTTPSVEQVGMLLRRAQQRRPSDFWINQSLVQFLEASRPRRVEEHIRFASVAVALQPQSPGAHLNLGFALQSMDRMDEAIAEYREAIRLKPDYSEAHSQLSGALKNKGQLDEAIAECREAVRLNKDNAKAHSYLGIALLEQGRLDEAIDECRVAVRLLKDDPGPHLNLGWALKENGQLDEAIDEYREAIRLKKDYAEARVNLGIALDDKGQPDEAIGEYREAIRLDKGLIQAHTNLGNAFLRLGEIRKAQEILRRAHQLYSGDPRIRQAIARQLQTIDRLVELEPRLPRFLKGEEQPADAAECLTLANLCYCKKLYAASARLYSEAFAERPSLADDLASGNRYDAACSAALASRGEAKDAASLGNKERARLRDQALAWLKDDLRAMQRLLEKDPDKAGPMVGQKLRHWLQDPDFNGVRGAESLAKLPEDERQSWQQLWADVADTLAKSRGKVAEKKKPDTK